MRLPHPVAPLRAPTTARAMRLRIARIASLGVAGAIVLAGALASSPGAEAAPEGSEFPETWPDITASSISGVAPSGVRSTVTLAAGDDPARGPRINATTTMMIGGAAPSYLATTSTGALQYFTSPESCSTTPGACGSITYTFDRPVREPVLYVTDVGAVSRQGDAEELRVVGAYDTSITVRDGAFTLDTPGSQSASMEIRDGGSTIGLADPSAFLGTIANQDSCEYFGCGAYRIATPAPTVTSVTFDLAQNAVGALRPDNFDGFNIVLAATPAPAALTVQATAEPGAVSRLGEQVDYAFVVTNDSAFAVSDARVDPTSFSGTGALSTPQCPAGPIEPGASITCTATYTVTQEDVDAGSLTATVTATATSPGSAAVDVVSQPSSARVAVVVGQAIDDVSGEHPRGPVTVAVLGNDEGALEASSLRLLDADGDPVSELVVSGEGTWTLAGDGSVTFTPADAFAGNPTPIRYAVDDANGNASQASVTITYADAPGPTDPGPGDGITAPMPPVGAPTHDALGAEDGVSGEPSATLPVTGTSIAAASLVGALLAAAGIVARLAARRRA